MNGCIRLSYPVKFDVFKHDDTKTYACSVSIFQAHANMNGLRDILKGKVTVPNVNEQENNEKKKAYKCYSNVYYCLLLAKQEEPKEFIIVDKQKSDVYLDKNLLKDM